MNHRKVILIVIAVVLAVVAALLLLTCQRTSLPGDRFLAAETDARNLSPGRETNVVVQVQQCSKLYTAEYRVHKIITHDDALRLKGQLMSKSFNLKVPLPDRKIAIPMDAKIKAYIDFSDFSEQNVERNGDKITIILPDPQVVMTSSKIDQNNVKQYVGLTRAHFSDAELANYQQQGREAILQSIPDMGIEETARANAAKVLVPMLTQLGYEEQNITIAFRKDLDFKHKYQGLIRFED